MSDQQHSLIKMLEQIIANNLHHGSDDMITDVVADHLHKFWARSMKQGLMACVDENPGALSPLARSSVAKLEAMPE